MRAIIFATGELAELAPLSDRTPVPLLPLVDRPLLQHVIESLVSRDVRRIDIVLSHSPETIENFLGDGARWGCRFTFHLARNSDRPYRLLRVLDVGDDPVLLGHADRLVELPADLLQASRSALLIWRNREVQNAPVFPQWTGWSVLTPEALKNICGDPTEEEFAAQLFQQIAAPDAWLEIPGPTFVRTFAEYFAAHEAVLDKKSATCILRGCEVESGVWLGRNVTLHPSARIQPPVFVGDNSVIGPAVALGPYAVVGPDCMLDAQSTVQRTIILPGSYVGEGLELTDVVVDRNMLVNLRCGTAITFSDPLLLGTLPDVGVVPPLQAFLSRVVGAALLVLALPALLLTALYLKVSRSGPVLFRHPVLRLPTLAHADAPTFNLWSFLPDTRWQCSHCSLRGLFLQFLPGLVNVARGELCFVGLPPRSPGDVEQLSPDWRAFHLGSKIGIVSETSFSIGSAFSDDERFASEAYYSCVASWRYDLCLLARYLVSCLGGPITRLPERRARARHFTHLLVLPADDTIGPTVAIGRDISLAGLKLESNHHYPPGTRIAVKLCNPRRQVTCIRVLIVCHATPQANGNVLLGCRFPCELTEEELGNMRD